MLALETAIARASNRRPKPRHGWLDDEAMTLTQLCKAMPGFDWRRGRSHKGSNAPESIVLGQPEFFKAFSQLALTTPLTTWKP